MIVNDNDVAEISDELKRIENDLDALKILVLKSRNKPRKIAKLEGSLSIEITEEDIEEAKKSLFKFSD